MAVDMAKEKLITREGDRPNQGGGYPEALLSRYRSYRAKAELAKKKVTNGMNAVTGAASGKAAFSAQKAEEMALDGQKVILVQHGASPEDVGGMFRRGSC